MTDETALADDLQARVSQAVHALARVRDAEDTTQKMAATAAQRIRDLEARRDYLAKTDFRIAFVGQIGVGKSALISVTTGLLVGERPRTKRDLKREAVLALGSGGTTVCEVRIRSTSTAREGKIGLRITPESIDSMRAMITEFAIDEWNKRDGSFNTGETAAASQPTPREVQRFIRNMTGLKRERSEISADDQRPGGPKSELFDPIDDLIKQHKSAESFAGDLVRRAHLMDRNQTEWWWPDGQDGRKALKGKFSRVNSGEDRSAVLPQLIELFVSQALPPSRLALDLEVVDTRGFDGQLGAREDILTRLRDDRCVVVACTSFNDAPSEALRSLLRSVGKDGSLMPALDRIVIVLADKGEAEQVNGADDDPDLGQMLKSGECKDRLEVEGLATSSILESVVAFDCLEDERERLVDRIDGKVESLIQAAHADLEQQLQDAATFIETLEDLKAAQAREEVDERLSTWFRANPVLGIPMRDPLDGLYEVVNRCRYGSRVHAMDRRFGVYEHLNGYSAVEVGASEAATRWTDATKSGVDGLFRALLEEPGMAEVQDHIRLRRRQFEAAYLQDLSRYAKEVRREVFARLKPAQVWRDCVGEWGNGPGFKGRVVEHLSDWSLRQHGILVAHESTEFTCLAGPEGWE